MRKTFLLIGVIGMSITHLQAQRTLIDGIANNKPTQILGEEANMGSVEKGKYADLIATDENPLQNIKTLQNVIFVMKDGIVVKQ